MSTLSSISKLSIFLTLREAVNPLFSGMPPPGKNLDKVQSLTPDFAYLYSKYPLNQYKADYEVHYL